MVEIQTAERGEPPGVIPELPTKLPRPGIDSADVGVAGGLDYVQGGSERHLQIQLALGPLARIR
jgi:hypothetical protein